MAKVFTGYIHPLSVSNLKRGYRPDGKLLLDVLYEKQPNENYLHVTVTFEQIKKKGKK